MQLTIRVNLPKYNIYLSPKDRNDVALNFLGISFYCARVVLLDSFPAVSAKSYCSVHVGFEHCPDQCGYDMWQHASEKS